MTLGDIMSVVAILRVSGAAVTYDSGLFAITGQGEATHEHVAALDSTGALDWVSGETRDWFYSPQLVNSLAPTSRPGSSGVDGYSGTEVEQYLNAIPSLYYRDEFRRIYESAESYKGQWNWPAFLFGPIWAINRGLWLPAAVYVAAIVTGVVLVAVVESAISSPVDLSPLIGIGLAVWMGTRGNWLLYNKQLKERNVPY